MVSIKYYGLRIGSCQKRLNFKTLLPKSKLHDNVHTKILRKIYNIEMQSSSTIDKMNNINIQNLILS